VTFNKINTYDFYREHLVNLDEEAGYNTHDRLTALDRVVGASNLVTGVIYEDPTRLSFADELFGYPKQPLAQASLELSKENYAEILTSFQ
jgi:2-oxoglutarate ferredoxin oxidoreductase subunit beta